MPREPLSFFWSLGNRYVHPVLLQALINFLLNRYPMARLIASPDSGLGSRLDLGSSLFCMQGLPVVGRVVIADK